MYEPKDLDLAGRKDRPFNKTRLVRTLMKVDNAQSSADTWPPIFIGSRSLQEGAKRLDTCPLAETGRNNLYAETSGTPCIFLVISCIMLPYREALPT